MIIARKAAIALGLGAIAMTLAAAPGLAATRPKAGAVPKSAKPIEVIEPLHKSWSRDHFWGGLFSEPVVGAYGYGIYCRYYACLPYQPPYIRDAYRGYYDDSWAYRHWQHW